MCLSCFKGLWLGTRSARAHTDKVRIMFFHGWVKIMQIFAANLNANVHNVNQLTGYPSTEFNESFLIQFFMFFLYFIQQNFRRAHSISDAWISGGNVASKIRSQQKDRSVYSWICWSFVTSERSCDSRCVFDARRLQLSSFGLGGISRR